jgi:hypothetical protein
VPHYFFDLHNDLDVLDPEGRECADLAAAKDNVLKEARAMLQVSIGETGKIDLRHHIDVRDESGAVVHVLHFEDAVTVWRGRDMISEPSTGV